MVLDTESRWGGGTSPFDTSVSFGDEYQHWRDGTHGRKQPGDVI